jgi:hypothetical protein
MKSMLAFPAARLAGLFVLAAVGCSGGPSAVDVPEVDPEAAAEKAINAYDANGDRALGPDELAKCPGILSKLTAYDADKNGTVEQAEIVRRIGELFKHNPGATQLNCAVTYGGRPLADAEVLFEPEEYLGEELQAARGVTDAAGVAAMGIPPEFLPEHLHRLKALHYGTFKVRITHPTITLPARYNTATELGYETESGNPNVQFMLVDK